MVAVINDATFMKDGHCQKVAEMTGIIKIFGLKCLKNVYGMTSESY